MSADTLVSFRRPRLSMRSDAPLVLIAEDQLLIAMDLKLTVEDLGYRTCGPVASGRAAVALAREARPDLLLLDVNLDSPLAGPTAARTIAATRRIPVIYATAYSGSEMESRILDLHPAPILPKPIDRDMLERALRSALAEARIGAMLAFVQG